MFACHFYCSWLKLNFMTERGRRIRKEIKQNRLILPFVILLLHCGNRSTHKICIYKSRCVWLLTIYVAISESACDIYLRKNMWAREFGGWWGDVSHKRKNVEWDRKEWMIKYCIFYCCWYSQTPSMMCTWYSFKMNRGGRVAIAGSQKGRIEVNSGVFVLVQF